MYKDKFKGKESRQNICFTCIPCVKCYPEREREVWIHLIDNILIEEMGFKTTRYNQYIYYKLIYDKILYILLKIDDVSSEE